MEIVSQGSRSVEDEGFLFDIFLSCRRRDVRLGFMGHLHQALNDKGIRTFLDSEDLERGQRLEKLFEYIQRSKLFVVVFSVGYADSRWCLKEIAHIVKCKRAIIPVFFDVEHGDVGHQRGPFESAFQRHEQDPTVDDNQVREWRDALKEAGGISGYSLKDTLGYEAKLVQIIVTEVLKRCTPAGFDVPYTVGLNEPLNGVENLLQCEANYIGSQIIGIHGIGGIRESLKARFDVLDGAPKEIFLDIACFPFSGQAKEAIYMWRELGFHPEIDLGVLACMSLVKLNDDGGFEMDEEIRRMGRNIVMDECPEDTSTCSRLWEAGDIRRALENTEGTSSSGTRGMIVEDPHARFRTGSFAGKNELKILHACGATFDGEPPHLPKTILWLSWRFFRSANSFPELFHLEDLVVLDLSGSMITRLWNQREQGMKVLKKMKSLILTMCKSLVICPDFSLLPSLEKLELGYCYKLSILHNSIGCLENLRELDISGCCALKTLPREICQLTSLEKFDLSNCYGLRALPTQFGGLKSLKELDLFEVGFTRLPGSVSNLESLTSLSIVYCQKLERLPENIGNIKTLTKLCIADVPFIKSLPNSIVHLTNLRSLVLHGCHALVNIPGSIGSLEKLEELRLVHCDELASLPSSIQRLTNLQSLEIGRKKFSASSVVGHAGAFPLLKKLELRDSDESGNLPSDLLKFSRLEDLTLDGFLSLHFPRIPPSMKTIWVSNCSALSSMSSISDCSSLQKLTIWDCPMLVDLQALGSLCQLKELSLDCIGITSLPQLPGSITSLAIDRCTALCSISGISGCNDLQKLTIWNCQMLVDLEVLGSLCRLEALFLHCIGITSLPQLPGSITNLEISEFTASARSSMSSISDCNGLPNLTIWNCQMVVDSQVLGSLCRLEKLSLHRMGITSLPQLPGSITSLRIYHCTALTTVPDVANLQALRRLFLEGCEALTELPLISNLKMLTFLDIRGCRMVVDIPQPHSSLTVLIARDCVALTTIRTLSTLPNLQQLDLTGCQNLVRVEGIENLTKLRRLELKGCLLLDLSRLKELFVIPRHPRHYSVSALDTMGVQCKCLPLPRSVRLEDMKLSVEVTGEFPAGQNVKLRVVFIADGLVQLRKTRTQRPIARDPGSFHPDEFEVHTLQKEDRKGGRACVVLVSVFPGSIYRIDLSLTPIHDIPMKDCFHQIYGARGPLDCGAEEILDSLAETSKGEEWITEVAFRLRGHGR